MQESPIPEGQTCQYQQFMSEPQCGEPAKRISGLGGGMVRYVCEEHFSWERPSGNERFRAQQ